MHEQDHEAGPASSGPDRTTTALPSVGLAIATIGRAELLELLDSAAASAPPPRAVGIGNQSGAPLPVDPSRYPFEVVVVESSGGASRGRNDAVRAIAGKVDLLGFPNDDSLLPRETLAQITRSFVDQPSEAVACSLVEFGEARFVLPPRGTSLDPVSAWRAIEQTSYIRTSTFEQLGGFREDLGTGSAGPWQSGEITDLLLRVLEAGGSIVSRPDIAVLGRGEQRDLSVGALVAKHRRYARGTGYVYRVHPYSWSRRLKVVLGPWRHPLGHHPEPAASLRIAVARFVGRIEGLARRAPTPHRTRRTGS